MRDYFLERFLVLLDLNNAEHKEMYALASNKTREEFLNYCVSFEDKCATRYDVNNYENATDELVLLANHFYNAVLTHNEKKEI